jgi:hypothetical protein
LLAQESLSSHIAHLQLYSRFSGEARQVDGHLPVGQVGIQLQTIGAVYCLRVGGAASGTGKAKKLNLEELNNIDCRGCARISVGGNLQAVSPILGRIAERELLLQKTAVRRTVEENTRLAVQQDQITGSRIDHIGTLEFPVTGITGWRIIGRGDGVLVDGVLSRAVELELDPGLGAEVKPLGGRIVVKSLHPSFVCPARVLAPNGNGARTYRIGTVGRDSKPCRYRNGCFSKFSVIRNRSSPDSDSCG